MIFCECPICDEEMNLRGYKENEVIKCPKCEIGSGNGIIKTTSLGRTF